MRELASHVLLLAALALAACGSDGGESSPGPDATGDTSADSMAADTTKDDTDAADVSPDPDVTDDTAPDVTDDTAPDAVPDATPDASPDPWTVTCANIPILGPQGDLVADACKACVDLACCDEAEACAADADCVAMRHCQAACSDGPCTEACWTTYPAGQTLASGFAGCRSAQCYPECADTLCFGKVVASEPAVDEYDMTVLISSTPDGAAVSGATVRFCPDGDSDCTNPGSSVTTNGYGIASLGVPSSSHGIAGYLDVSGPTILPVLYHRIRYTDLAGLPGSVVAPVTISAFPSSTVDLIASIAGVDVDPTRGVVFFSTRGCAEQYMGNVSVSTTAADDQTKVVYIVDGMPSTTATMTTPADGSGVIFNVRLTAPTITISATFGGVVYSTHEVHVRAGALTSLDAVPTP